MGRLNLGPSQGALAPKVIEHVTDAPTLKETSTPKYKEASARCEKTGGDPESVGKPEGTDELNGKFRLTLNRIEEKLGPIEEYRQCMKTAGVALATDEGGDGWGSLWVSLESQMPTPPRPGEEPSQQWSDYLQTEAKALNADEACRAEKYREGLALLKPLLDEFQTAHADELAATAAGWNDILDQAKAKGFTTATE
ncbi:MAG TPA: hypothetical protein VLL08_02085 [Kineosporiaceae bacterium]|nr:hypothetical protein [Kineosporiaceae bacterium]